MHCHLPKVDFDETLESLEEEVEIEEEVNESLLVTFDQKEFFTDTEVPTVDWIGTAQFERFLLWEGTFLWPQLTHTWDMGRVLTKECEKFFCCLAARKISNGLFKVNKKRLDAFLSKFKTFFFSVIASDFLCQYTLLVCKQKLSFSTNQFEDFCQIDAFKNSEENLVKFTKSFSISREIYVNKNEPKPQWFFREIDMTLK